MVPRRASNAGPEKKHSMKVQITRSGARGPPSMRGKQVPSPRTVQRGAYVDGIRCGGILLGDVQHAPIGPAVRWKPFPASLRYSAPCITFASDSDNYALRNTA